ncbi:phosphotransferase enzyme family protein [Taibaiella chishuiensis]|uniref:Ser/Thr protein kinase RdoA (MazF antagonist) n=1 Tax=Taibaiella chishuiensis TaxID=1434707 RepID=A0A2P8CVT7_9BACT|nr:phosphotransferase [Taibaiella chishuiensis]PSK89088.1 Ser/Thr protein kinase RdoA (MazF antagonist) [Taibaiella chishuiensis]
MEIFPVQYSTLSALALGERVATVYNLPVTQCRYLLRGVSDTYVVTTTTGQYILKVYRDAHRSVAEINGELALLDALVSGGAQVVRPIANPAGERLLPLQAPEGLRYAVLFSFAAGRTLAGFSEAQLGIIGREMAFNHNITAVVQLPWPRKAYTHQTTVERPLSLLQPAFDEYPEGYALLQQTAARVAGKLAAYDTAKFNVGYCHYDYFPKNFFFDGEDKMTLFDFDFAGRGFLAYDLASIFIHFYFDTRYKQKPREQAKAEMDTIVAGYRQLRAISGEELEAIPLLAYQLLLFYLGFQYENFDDWSNFFFSTRFLKARLEEMEDIASEYCNL